MHVAKYAIIIFRTVHLNSNSNVVPWIPYDRMIEGETDWNDENDGISYVVAEIPCLVYIKFFLIFRIWK